LIKYLPNPKLSIHLLSIQILSTHHKLLIHYLFLHQY